MEDHMTCSRKLLIKKMIVLLWGLPLCSPLFRCQKKIAVEQKLWI